MSVLCSYLEQRAAKDKSFSYEVSFCSLHKLNHLSWLSWPMIILLHPEILSGAVFMFYKRNSNRDICVSSSLPDL